MHHTSLSPMNGDLIALADYSKRDKPWDGHKKNCECLSHKYKLVGYDRYFERMSGCASWLEFALKEIDEKNNPDIKLFSAKFCRVRSCPICQWRKSLMWVARLYEALPKILEDYPKIRFIFLTLTVPNCQLKDLKKTISKMNKAWERLSKRKAFPGIGCIKTLEVTLNAKSEAHPHFHIVIAVEGGYFGGRAYLSQKEWTKLWQHALRTEEQRIVNVKTIKPKGKSEDSDLDKLINALRECVKYSTKPDDLLNLSPDQLETFTNQMHKVRAVNPSGIFKQYMKTEEPEDLISEGEQKDTGQPQADISSFWDKKTERYYISDK